MDAAPDVQRGELWAQHAAALPFLLNEQTEMKH